MKAKKSSIFCTSGGDNVLTDFGEEVMKVPKV